MRQEPRAKNKGLPRTPSQLYFAGDTWSRFVPQFQSQPMASTGLASGAAFERR